MSAADRMVVRTRSGAYKSLPRRTALGLIAAGRVTPEPAPVTPQAAPVTAVVPPAQHDDEHQALAAMTTEPVTITGTPDEIAATMDALAPVGDVDQVTPKLQYVSSSLDADVPTVEAVPLPPEPKPTARRGEWADYADSLGVQVTSDMTKREIQQAAQEAATSLTNLPQPALTGGRLETPEDEPAAETVADDPDTRTR